MPARANLLPEQGRQTKELTGLMESDQIKEDHMIVDEDVRSSTTRPISDHYLSVKRGIKHKKRKLRVKGKQEILAGELGLSVDANGRSEAENTDAIGDSSKESDLGGNSTTPGNRIDKVWQYVCKRAVLVATPPYYLSPKGNVLENVKFREKALVNVQGTARTSLMVFGREILVTVTCEAAVAQEWLERQHGRLFGLDVEWRPNRGNNTSNKVALLQLSGEKECLMIQMLFIDSMPQALMSFLMDSEKRMAGVGVKEDAKKLERDYGLVCNGLVELTSLAVEQLGKPECKNMGLKALAREVIGVQMQKSKRVTLSDWAKPKLDKNQVLYACVDAWVSFAVFHKLQVKNA